MQDVRAHPVGGAHVEQPIRHPVRVREEPDPAQSGFVSGYVPMEPEGDSGRRPVLGFDVRAERVIRFADPA